METLKPEPETVLLCSKNRNLMKIKEDLMAGWTGLEPATSGLTGHKSLKNDLPITI
jgi:hypothetical protein